MIIEILAILSFTLMHAIEMYSFSSRAAGKLIGSTALGTTFHYSMHTASRFLLIIFLPSLAFLVENNTSIDHYLLVVIVSLFISFIASLIIILKFNSAQLFFQNVFLLYSESNILLSLVKSVFLKTKNDKDLKQIGRFKFGKLSKKKVLISFVSYSFLNTGFFVAFLFSFIYYEYRLTVSQFSTMFHGVGAVIVAFYLDPMLSRSIDETLVKRGWTSDMYSILFGRMLSYLVAFSLFLMYYFLVAL